MGGIVPAVRGQVTVRDTVRGATAPVIDHRCFAIVIPPSHGHIIQVHTEDPRGPSPAMPTISPFSGR